MKNIILLFSLLFLYNCAAKPLQTSCSIKLNKSYSQNDPSWFKKKENEEYNYIVKNKESSGNRDLAQTKNLLVSEILLANKTSSDFMSCEDQNKALYTIRNSDLDGVNQIQNGKIIKNLIKGYSISNNETIEDDGKFTNYLRIIKLIK